MSLMKKEGFILHLATPFLFIRLQTDSIPNSDGVFRHNNSASAVYGYECPTK